MRLIKFIFIVFIPISLSGNTSDSLKNMLNSYQQDFQQQKVYVQTDKDSYYSGETIWFKAYVLNSGNHTPDSVESTLYADLVHQTGVLVQRDILKVEKGIATGDFELPDSLSRGNYVLRAYTQWMLNFDEGFIFQKPLFVYNPGQESYITRREVKENKQFNKEIDKLGEEMNFDFFAEGGRAVAGVPNTFAFRAYDDLRKGLKISGWVSSNGRDTIIRFRSGNSGIGKFSFMPEPERDYTLFYQIAGEKTKKYNLKLIEKEGVVLSVENNKSGYGISVRRIFQNEVPDELRNLYLAIHSGGDLISVQHITENQQPYFYQIPKSEIPEGIIVATLFDAQLNVMNERLFFHFPEKQDFYNAEINVNEGDTFQLVINSKIKDLPQGNYSMRVIGKALNSKTKVKNNIQDYILLHSEFSDLLPPVFQEINQRERDMDALMIAMNWQRFKWEEVFNDNPEQPEYPKESGFRIYGKFEPSEQSKMATVFSFEVGLKTNDSLPIRISGTDKNGYFVFQDNKQQGDFNAEISVYGKRQSKAESIEMFPDLIKPLSFMKDYRFSKIEPDRKGRIFGGEYHQWKAPERVHFFEDNLSYFYGNADQVVYLKENEQRFRNLRDVLKSNVPGLQINGNSILIRGISSINFSNQPLILVDNQELSSGQFLNLSPFEISHIEIYKGTSTSIFGVRGTNGAIVAHSRRSTLPQNVIIEYIIEGYYVPKAFKKYDGIEKLLTEYPDNYNATLYWEPQIRGDENNFPRQVDIRLPVPVSQIDITIEGVSDQGEVFHQNLTKELDKSNL